MLGKTAGGLFWMFRYLERSENTARLVDAGFRISLTRPQNVADDWESILSTAGARAAFLECNDTFETSAVVDFLLRDAAQPFSVISMVKNARNNARMVRTALTQEVWESVNDCWLTLKQALARPVREADLPNVLGLIRQQSALVRGALYGTMLRNDIYNFARIGTFLERADNTARILDVKYYLLLPSASYVGSSLDISHWETILKSASVERAFQWLHGHDVTPKRIADFLIFDTHVPRSLVFCNSQLVDNLRYLVEEYRQESEAYRLAKKNLNTLSETTIDVVFRGGLHEFIQTFIEGNNELGYQIEKDYRFYG